MHIQISGIYGRISQCQEHYIFSLFQIGFHGICCLIMVVFQYLLIFCHRHRYRDQFFFVQFRVGAFYDLIRYTALCIVSRHCDHAVFADQAKCL